MWAREMGFFDRGAGCGELGAGMSEGECQGGPKPVGQG